MPDSPDRAADTTVFPSCECSFAYHYLTELLNHRPLRSLQISGQTNSPFIGIRIDNPAEFRFGCRNSCNSSPTRERVRAFGPERRDSECTRWCLGLTSAKDKGGSRRIPTLPCYHNLSRSNLPAIADRPQLMLHTRNVQLSFLGNFSQLRQSPSLELPDAFFRHTEVTADLLQRLGLSSLV